MSVSVARKPLVAANWKVNGSIDLCDQYASRVRPPDGVDCWVFPSALHVSTLLRMLAGESNTLKVGVQDIYPVAQGAFTGEISALLAREVGATAAILGHSERRGYFNESSEFVAKKVKQALQYDLEPIVCVGEQRDERVKGKTEEVVMGQLSAIDELDCENIWRRLTVAYEPVWAIGTGESASPADVESIHAYIRSLVNQWDSGAGDGLRVLYGGSVNTTNAQQLAAQTNVDGFLVGGASLDVTSFQIICESAV